MKATILSIVVAMGILVSSVLISPIKTQNETITHIHYPNPYGDGIGAPHNVVKFTTEDGQTVYEWTLVHGD